MRVIQLDSDIPCQEMISDDSCHQVINDNFIHDEDYELPPEFSSLIFYGETNALLTFNFFASNHEISEIGHQNIKEKTGQKHCIYQFVFNSLMNKYVSIKQSRNSSFYQRMKSKRRKYV